MVLADTDVALLPVAEALAENAVRASVPPLRDTHCDSPQWCRRRGQPRVLPVIALRRRPPPRDRSRPLLALHLRVHACACVQALSTHRLTLLDASGNRVPADACAALAGVLERSQSLAALHLRRCVRAAALLPLRMRAQAPRWQPPAAIRAAIHVGSQRPTAEA